MWTWKSRLMRSDKELLIDCLERLNRSGISCMLTGSMAGNYWRIPRTTHDLDFVGPDDGVLTIRRARPIGPPGRPEPTARPNRRLAYSPADA